MAPISIAVHKSCQEDSVVFDGISGGEQCSLVEFCKEAFFVLSDEKNDRILE